MLLCIVIFSKSPCIYYNVLYYDEFLQLIPDYEFFLMRYPYFRVLKRVILSSNWATYTYVCIRINIFFPNHSLVGTYRCSVFVFLYVAKDDHVWTVDKIGRINGKWTQIPRKLFEIGQSRMYIDPPSALGIQFSKNGILLRFILACSLFGKAAGEILFSEETTKIFRIGINSFETWIGEITQWISLVQQDKSDYSMVGVIQGIVL